MSGGDRSKQCRRPNPVTHVDIIAGLVR